MVFPSGDTRGSVAHSSSNTSIGLNLARLSSELAKGLIISANENGKKSFRFIKSK